MTGRIKLLNSDDTKVQEADEPAIPYTYDAPTGFDAQCGTFLLNDFVLPHPECPDTFVCDAPDAGFSSCINAMNCHMMVGMTTGRSSGSDLALFVHQMIPHHQNAVNMAKALLKTGSVNCADLGAESPDCSMEIILREIINGQNHQIQVMRGILKELSLPEEDDCEVKLATNGGESPNAPPRNAPDEPPVSQPPTSSGTSAEWLSMPKVLLLFLWYRFL